MATTGLSSLETITIPSQTFSSVLGQLTMTESQLAMLRETVGRLWMDYDEGDRSPWVQILQGVERTLGSMAKETAAIATTLDEAAVNAPTGTGRA